MTFYRKEPTGRKDPDTIYTLWTGLKSVIVGFLESYQGTQEFARECQMNVMSYKPEYLNVYEFEIFISKSASLSAA